MGQQFSELDYKSVGVFYEDGGTSKVLLEIGEETQELNGAIREKILSLLDSQIPKSFRPGRPGDRVHLSIDPSTQSFEAIVFLSDTGGVKSFIGNFPDEEPDDDLEKALKFFRQMTRKQDFYCRFEYKGESGDLLKNYFILASPDDVRNALDEMLPAQTEHVLALNLERLAQHIESKIEVSLVQKVKDGGSMSLDVDLKNNLYTGMAKLANGENRSVNGASKPTNKRVERNAVAKFTL